MNIHDPLADLRAWYDRRVQKQLGALYSRNMAIPEGSARWLQDHVRRNHKNIVEFGAGFSTLVFVRALERTNGSLHCLDHSSAWLRFVRQCLVDLGANLGIVKFCTTHEFLAQTEHPRFDFVFVDHGPTYSARAATLAPIIALCRQVGCDEIVLDDWHLASGMQRMYCDSVREITGLLGLSVTSIADSAPAHADRSLARIGRIVPKAK